MQSASRRGTKTTFSRNRRTSMNKLLAGLLLGASFALTACGGDADDTAEADTAPEADAMAADTSATTPAPADTTTAAETGATAAEEDGMDPGAAGDPASDTADDTADDTTEY
jgi:hypothetical protein